VPQLFISEQRMVGNTLKLGRRFYFLSGIMYGAQLGVRGNNWGMGQGKVCLSGYRLRLRSLSGHSISNPWPCIRPSCFQGLTETWRQLECLQRRKYIRSACRHRL
jgi:hypothetical protein